MELSVPILLQQRRRRRVRRRRVRLVLFRLAMSMDGAQISALMAIKDDPVKCVVLRADE